MHALLAKAVGRCGAPAYPTKMQIAADPGLLSAHLPPGWLSNREIAALAGALLAAGATGCGHSQPPGKAGLSPAAAAVVAPIFVHGEGTGDVQGGPPRGMLGCIAVAAPVYLSEDDAAQVIGEQLRAAGIDTLERHVRLDAVSIKGHEYQVGYEWASGTSGGAFADISGPLVADLFDPRRGIVLQFVNGADYYALGGWNEYGGWGDYKEAAANLAQQVQRQGRGYYFGAFYDPGEHYTFSEVVYPKDLPRESDQRAKVVRDAFQRAEDKARARSKELLRLQVKDFIDWLKAQGVI